MKYVLLALVLLGAVLLLCMGCRRSETPEQKLIRRIKVHLDTYVTRLKTRFPDDPRVERLRQRYASTKVFESNNHETFTLNKGEQIVMCLRNYAQHKKLHDEFNLLVFVGLHELAHVMSTSVDHTVEFWANFKFILRCAAEMNLYDPVDYALDPMWYCAMVVHDNPYFYERTPREFLDQMQAIVLG